MDQNSDDAIVASLMLLLDGMGNERIRTLAARVLPHRVKWVCCECGSENITAEGTMEWHPIVQQWVWRNCERDWCEDCDTEVSTEERPLDWVKSAEEADADS